MTLEYVLKQHGLTPGVDVEVINNIQFNLMGGAFESGTGDFVTLFEPTASEFEAAGKGYVVANVGLESGEVPYTAFMVAPDTIEEDPAFVEAFVRALYRAQLWVQSASDAEIAEAMQPFLPRFFHRNAFHSRAELPGNRFLDADAGYDGRLVHTPPRYYGERGRTERTGGIRRAG